MSSSMETESLFSLPIAAMEYADMGGHPTGGGVIQPSLRAANGGGRRKSDGELADLELASRIQRERAEAAQHTEQKLRLEYEAKLEATRASIADALTGFEAQRAEYYARVEAEVVQLALAIAAKILHRESQVDPMLIAALVRITIEKMREGSIVTLRVATGRAKRWKDYFAGHSTPARVEVTEDASFSNNDCILETELGVTNISLDTQLKEVEQGFFDLLALRPESR